MTDIAGLVWLSNGCETIDHQTRRFLLVHRQLWYHDIRGMTHWRLPSGTGAIWASPDATWSLRVILLRTLLLDSGLEGLSANIFLFLEVSVRIIIGTWGSFSSATRKSTCGVLRWSAMGWAGLGPFDTQVVHILVVAGVLLARGRHTSYISLLLRLIAPLISKLRFLACGVLQTTLHFADLHFRWIYSQFRLART